MIGSEPIQIPEARGRPQLSSQQVGLRSKNTMLIRRLLLGSFHLLPACPFPSRARYSTFPSSEFPKFFSLFNDFTHFPPAPTPKMTGISLGSSKIQHAITSLNLAIDSTGRRDAHQLFVTLASMRLASFQEKNISFFCLLHLLFLYHGAKVRAHAFRGCNMRYSN